VSAAVEAGAPNGGDGNGDGIPDAQQAEVASLPNNIDGRYVTPASPGGTVLDEVAAIPNPSPLDTPDDVAFPVGHFAFTVRGLTVGAATTTVLPLPPGTTADTYYQYGPTPDNTTPHWYEFLYDATTATGAVIDNAAGTITLHFRDGQRGDRDLTANGVVVDPGAPARRATVAARIDARPGDAQNRLNLASRGVIPVAILSTATFDAATVLFANARAVQFALQDVNHDGRLDLVLHFRIGDTMLGDLYRQLIADDVNADGVLDSSSQRAAVSLTGFTRDGTCFAGSDSLVMSLSGQALRSLLDELASAGVI
jgi:hypothetical protein